MIPPRVNDGAGGYRWLFGSHRSGMAHSSVNPKSRIFERDLLAEK